MCRIVRLLLALLYLTTQVAAPPVKWFSIFDREESRVNAWFYTYSLALIYNTPKKAAEYASRVEEESLRYNLPSDLVARLIFKESKFREKRKSYGVDKNTKTRYIIACGPMMVRPTIWSHILYRVDTNLSFKLRMSQRPITDADYLRYFTTVKYGVKTGCYILRNYVDNNHGDYRLALTHYWSGKNSKQSKAAKRGKDNHYVEDILDADIEAKIRLYHTWVWDKTPYERRRQLYLQEKYKQK